jgi:hypothetical protein
MTDIYIIKDLTDLFRYLERETWYMLSIGLCILLIYIAYIRAFDRYYTHEPISLIAIPNQKPSIHEIIDNIPLENTDFFDQLSMTIRSYLEISNKVLSATKKTNKDFLDENIPSTIKEILSICTYHEYANIPSTVEERKQIKERLKRELDSISHLV